MIGTVAFRVLRRAICVLACIVLSTAMLAGCSPQPRAQVGAPNAQDSAVTTQSAEGDRMKTIYIAGGCFWGLEKYIGLVEGVTSTEAGYANGATPNATYRDDSGYAEVVKVVYDPGVAPLPFLLDLFYDAIDPTSVNRQGNDIGVEYRTGIYYEDAADVPAIEASLAELQKRYTAPIAIEVAPVANYAPAEEHHQDYLDKNPGGYCHIPRKLFDAAAKAKAK